MTGADIRVSIVVAADESDVIGRDGGLPWHLPEDLRRFQRLTMGHVVVAGRLTHESIVERLGRPLPGRVTVVVSRSSGDRPDTPEVVYRPDLARALATAREIERAGSGEEVFVVGGERVYGEAVKSASTVYLTRVHGVHDGDAMLPPGLLDGFRLIEREPHEGFTFETYGRV